MADLTSSWSRYLPVDIGLPFSIAAFRGAKKCNPCLRNVLLLYLGTVRTQRQFQMLSCKAGRGNDLPKVQHGPEGRNRWTGEADLRLREHQSS
jgi:hypothetical protein